MIMLPFMQLFVKLLFSACHNKFILINLIYKNNTKLKFITSFITNKRERTNGKSAVTYPRFSNKHRPSSVYCLNFQGKYTQ